MHVTGTPAPESLLSEPLPNATRALVERAYAADISLYHFALKLHREQLGYVRGLPSPSGSRE